MTGLALGKILLYQRDDGSPALEVKFESDTAWLSQQQIAELFQTSRTNVVEHIKHIYLENELDEVRTCRKFRQVRTEGLREVTRELPFYNLDLILSVGYRVKSKVATQFRIWATDRLREYLVQGVAVNEKRLEQLGKMVQLLTRSEDQLMAGVGEIFASYLPSLRLLRQFDSGELEIPHGEMPSWRLNVDEARGVIQQIQTAFPEDKLLGIERNDALDGVVQAIYQTFGGIELYPSAQERAANLLYLIVKDHPLSDGNKRTAAALFIMFLAKNNVLHRRDGQPFITNNALAALTLMVAMSEPKEKDLMVALIVNMLTEEGR